VKGRLGRDRTSKGGFRRWQRRGLRFELPLQLSQIVFQGRNLLSRVFGFLDSPSRTDERHEGQDDDTSNQCQDHQNDQAFHDKLAAG